MKEILNVGCPECGNVLKLPNVPDIKNKVYTCKVCGKKSKVSQSTWLGFEDLPPKSEAENNPTKTSTPVPSHAHNPAQSAASSPSQNGNSSAEEPYAQIDEIVNIKCTCGKVISFRYKPGAENKYVTCPLCHVRSRVFTLEKLADKPNQTNSSTSNPSTINTSNSSTANTSKTNPLAPSEQQSAHSQSHSEADKPQGHSNRTSSSQRSSYHTPTTVSDSTQLYSKDDNTRFSLEEDKTTIASFSPKSQGAAQPKMAVLKVKGAMRVYKLSEGRNVIGRKANSSSATVQIETDTPRLSREHFVIETSNSNEGPSYYISLYKDRVNETRVGNSKLEFGDKIRLENGTEIRLPDITVVFELLNND